MVNKMMIYIIKRILLAIPMILILMVLTWIFAQLMPGDPSSNFPLGTPPEVIAAYQEKFHLNDPWYIQFKTYFINFFHGDLGISSSVSPNEKVSDYIRIALPRTIEIAIIPIVLVPIIGIKTGLISVKYKDKWQDTLIRVFAVLLVALPSFF